MPKERIFQCPYCHRSYILKGFLNNHIENVHKKKKPFKCSMCKKSFVTEGYLNTHKKYVHRQNNSLSKTNKQTHKVLNPFTPDLPYAQEIVHNEQSNDQILSNIDTFNCHFCHLDFKGKDAFITHAKYKHEKIWEFMIPP